MRIHHCADNKIFYLFFIVLTFSRSTLIKTLHKDDFVAQLCNFVQFLCNCPPSALNESNLPLSQKHVFQKLHGHWKNQCPHKKIPNLSPPDPSLSNARFLTPSSMMSYRTNLHNGCTIVHNGWHNAKKLVWLKATWLKP